MNLLGGWYPPIGSSPGAVLFRGRLRRRLIADPQNDRLLFPAKTIKKFCGGA
jgi:hypothetical protein